jgi:hypothetical protein
MTKKLMSVLALALLAPAAFGQSGTAAAPTTEAPVKILRDEIKRDKADMVGKTKAARAEHKQLLAQEKVELVQAAKSSGTRAEKKQARVAVRAKYAQLLKDERAKVSFQKKNLREDITSKQGQIKKLRQS